VDGGGKRLMTVTPGASQKSAEPGVKKSSTNDEHSPPVPQTDTGRWVEDTKANGRTRVKELGKIAL
jgi:hypothetical protein